MSHPGLDPSLTIPTFCSLTPKQANSAGLQIYGASTYTKTESLQFYKTCLQNFNGV